MSYIIDPDGYIVWASDTDPTSVITRSGDSATTSPDGILSYVTRGEGRNVVTDLIDGSIAVTLVSPRPRTGTLNLLYFNESAAWQAYDLHGTADTFTIADSTVNQIDMTYVVTGRTLTLDPQTQSAWLLDIDYQEVEL